MLNKHERPLNKTERRCLVYMLETVPGLVTKLGTIRWFSLWTGILILCIFLFAIGLFRAGGPSGVWLAVLPVVVIFGILAFYSAYMVVSSYIHLSRFSKRFARDEAPRVRAALEDGRASVCSITSDRVVFIEAFEDEDSVYIFDLGDSTSFFIRGQDYSPENDEEPWPAHQFEIVRTVLNDQMVGIFSARGRIENMRKISMAEMPESFWSCDEPKTETILSGKPDEILSRLGYKAAH